MEMMLTEKRRLSRPRVVASLYQLPPLSPPLSVFFYRQNTFSSFLFQFLEKIPAQLYTNDLQISEIYLFHPQEFKIWQTYLLVVMLIVMLVAMVEMLVMMCLATLVVMLVISAGDGVGGHDKC